MITGTMDFETANTAGIDLTEVGADAYASHPATEVLCLHIKFKGAVTGHFLWAPGMIGGEDDALAAYARNPDVIFESHSAAFEQMVWQRIMVDRFGFPPLPINRFRCTMAQALYRGLPGGLDKAAGVLGMPERKDKEASKLVYSLGDPMTKKRWEQLCPAGTAKAVWKKQYKPIPDRTWETMERCYDYCKQDTVVEEGLSEITGSLSDYELEVWLLDQEINQRGVLLDVEFIRAAQRIVAEVHDEITAEFTQLTTCEMFPNGLIPTQVKKLKEWLGKVHGLWPASLDKEQMHAWGIGELEDETTGPHTDLPGAVRRVLEIRSVLGSAAVKKLATMLASLGPGSRARYLLQYYGAVTGRWAARLWQPHNLPRGLLQVWNGEKLAPPPHDQLYRAIMMGKAAVEVLWGKRNVLKAIASSLRFAMIAPPDKALFWADFSGIEMRTVIALSGSPRAAELARGEDVYSGMAVMIYNLAIRPGAPMDEVKNTKWYAKWYGVNTEQRQTGKNTVLGCGFGMGKDTFWNRYCADQPIEFADNVIKTYRKQWAPEVQWLWWDLQAAALAVAFKRPDDEACVKVWNKYRIRYELETHMGYTWMVCALPDGQRQYYMDPQPVGDYEKHMALSQHERISIIESMRANHLPRESDDRIAFWRFHTWKDGQWKETQAYGGLLTENVVQKLARGMLCEAMLRLRAAGFDIVMHVHDEVLAEGPAEIAWEVFRDVMIKRSDTAKMYGIPIAVEGDKSTRYRK